MSLSVLQGGHCSLFVYFRDGSLLAMFLVISPGKYNNHLAGEFDKYFPMHLDYIQEEKKLCPLFYI
jgi:hypothetical protein